MFGDLQYVPLSVKTLMGGMDANGKKIRICAVLNWLVIRMYLQYVVNHSHGPCNLCETGSIRLCQLLNLLGL